MGKSALINRILGQNVAQESAFGEGGGQIREYAGEQAGIQLKLIDTPGLDPSSNATSYNRSVLKKVHAHHACLTTIRFARQLPVSMRCES